MRASLLVFGIALLLCLVMGRLQTPIQSNGSQLAVTERGNFVWGPIVTLDPGDYRASLTLSIRQDSKSDPGAAALVIGFTPLGDGWSPGVKELRLLDLAGQNSRTYLVPFHQDTLGKRAWSWRYYSADTALVQESSVVWRERTLNQLATSGTPGAKSAIAIILRTLLALAALSFATLMGSRVLESRADAGPISLTVLGIAGYVAAAVALVAIEVTFFPIAEGSSGQSTWRFFPGLENPLAEIPRALSAALALASAFLIGIVAGYKKALIWVVPVAALGVFYAQSISGHRSDFQVYYAAGQALWLGINPYALHLETVLNPPPFVLACSLLPLLPITVAGIAWFGIKAALAVWIVPLARIGFTTGREHTRFFDWRAPEWIAVLICGRFLWLDLQYGNTNLVVLWSLLGVGATWAATHYRTAASIAILGAAVKVTPLLTTVGAFFAGKRRWAVAVLALGAVVFLISSVALEIIAPGGGLGFIKDALPRPDDLALGRVDNQSLRGMMDRYVGGAEVITATTNSVPTLGLGAVASRIVQIMLSIAVLAALFILGRRAGGLRPGSDGSDAWPSLWAGIGLGILLLSPGSWAVHFVLLYPAAVVLAGRARRGQILPALALGIMALVIYVPAFSRFAGDWMLALSALTLLAMGLLLYLVAFSDGGKIAMTTSTEGIDAGDG